VSKILIIYYSESGNTEKMAQFIAQGVKKVKGAEVEVKRVEKVKVDELLKADGIIVGSPTYYGTMSYRLKQLFDESVRFHGDLDGKVGGAFSSAGNIGGGNETTIKSILEAMLIHGMIIQGDPSGDHYGPVSIGSPDARVERECLRFGQRMAELVEKLK